MGEADNEGMKRMSELDKKNNSEMKNIENIIRNKTPIFIAKPIIATTNILETFRENTKAKASDQKVEAQKAIDAIKKTEEEKPIDNKIVKPLAYLKMFFFQLVSIVFTNQFVFYIVLFGIIFLILRFIWHKIF